MHTAPYNWVREQKPDSFAWDAISELSDCEGAHLDIGASVQLLRESIAFDERGVSQGIWAKDLIFSIIAVSAKMKVVMFEGEIGYGWASGVLPSQDLKLYAGNVIPNDKKT